MYGHISSFAAETFNEQQELTSLCDAAASSLKRMRSVTNTTGGNGPKRKQSLSYPFIVFVIFGAPLSHAMRNEVAAELMAE